MKKRDYELVKNGKYNMTAIMQKAWAYKNDLFWKIHSGVTPCAKQD